MEFTAAMLPDDARQAVLAGRLLLDEGPTPIIIRESVVEDVSRTAPTIADLMDLAEPARVPGEQLFGIEELARLPRGRFLAPIDLQAVKAAGVTFAISAIERVIEERARGDFRRAAEIRDKLEQRIGGAIRSVVPGTEAAARLKEALIDDGLWSQYLEVAIGPDAEIFTKTAPLASVGWGAEIGVRSDSSWNNPEPEVVLVVNSRGDICGATLGNDVNLRDFEGRSALLLSKAKDNNASCAIGPFVRLFDDGFTLDDVRSAVVELDITGSDGFRLHGQSRMSEISRDPEELVRQAMSEHHYPDGFVLFLGTLFAPTEDRDEPGRGFTHKIGDEVRISTPRLGALANIVSTSRDAPAWKFGTRALMRNLAARGLINEVPS
ncbi:MAG TPA: fumarylacetoacetate hydrolase family protein [Sphingomicrobium sp.]|jgi:fumarylacetoacetate (FAA) hydrolase family protein|nr:fumarylacetoacetate hydrolase family protein [Sphingomicrobium sp.]